MTFKPIYDLESLTEEQRQQYYLNACEYYGVPSDLNALAFIWMDSGDGKRNLTLYAKKSATDIIRANKGISTTRLTKDEGPGYVAWVAEGRDSTGRVEMAVGSASTEGLKGQHLATAIMLSQTRATRRMTLQFVGGLMDESEVYGPVSDINRSSASLASLAVIPTPIQPEVQPNTEPGKDITQNPPKEGVSLQSIAPKPFLTPETIKLVEKPLDGGWACPKPFQDGDITPSKVETIEEVMQEPKTRRGRRKSGIVLDCPASEDFGTGPYLGPELPTAESAVKALDQVKANQAVNAKIDAVTAQAFTQEQFVKATIDPIVEKDATELMPEVNPDLPTEAELKAWKARIFVYTNDILPKGGMTKADGIIWKLRKFVKASFPNAPEKNGVLTLTNTEWKKLLETLDNIVKERGVDILVKTIEEAAAKG